MKLHNWHLMPATDSGNWWYPVAQKPNPQKQGSDTMVQHKIEKIEGPEQNPNYLTINNLTQKNIFLAYASLR